MATGFYLIDHPNRHLKQYGERRRGGEKPSGTIIIHTAENVADQIGEDLGAESVARYCSTRDTYGAYHRLVDADTIVKMVPFGYETWHCTKTNPWSIGISAAVRAGDWKKYGDAYETRVLRNLARAAADAVRSLKKDWGITVPIKHISGADARAQKPGFTGHGQTDPGRRSDPGADFDWARFLKMVQEELDGATTPDEEEDDFMATLTDSEKKALLADIKTIKGLVDAKVLEGPYEPVSKRKWVSVTRALRLIRLNGSETRQRVQDVQAQLRGLRSLVETMAKNQNLDPERVYALLDENLKEAFGDLRITSEPDDEETQP